MDFQRPREGFKYSFGGWKTNAAPNSLPQGKYNLAVNVRGYDDDSTATRPGQVQKFQTGNAYIVNVRAYTQLSTDDLPRYLAVDVLSEVWLDNGVSVGTLANAHADALIISMIPFRPNQSVTPWMYIGSLYDYQKFSAPVSISNAVTQQKVGIAEPQEPPEACLQPPGAAVSLPILQSLGDPNTPGGTAGSSTTSSRVSDSVAAAFKWPAQGTDSWVYSLQVGSPQQYQRFQSLNIAGTDAQVMDVYQQFPAALAISAIYYFTGSTGRCVVVPSNVGVAPGVAGQSVFSEIYMSGLRRGALVRIGTEVCMVLSITTGPDGSTSFETSTTGSHTSSESLNTVPAIMVMMGANNVPSGGITSGQRNYQVTSGIGTQSLPFTPFASLDASYGEDDYIHLSINVDVLANLNEMKVLFDVGDGSFTENFYYYTVRPSDLVAGIDNSLTQLAVAQIITQRATIDEEEAATANNQGTTSSSAQTSPGDGQWSEIVFPVSALTRVGDDQTKSLSQIVAVQFLWNAGGTINVATGTQDFYIFGGSGPDVGDVGSPYQYRVRPRSSATGVVGNPSPATRYGVNPRRQPVNVSLPSAAYDSQIDTWDVERYGGSVTSWRFVGSTPSTNTDFLDIYDDSAAQAGDALDFDNFEPWPSVYIPLTGIADVYGTVATLALTTPASAATVLQMLPGTLVQLGGLNVYTLNKRPVSVGGGVYRLEFVENAGASTNTVVNIQEPFIANQHLSYLWGPDANGTVFACGDQYRAGTVSFAKNYAPDSVPDSYNIEVTPPTEPLLGGVIVDGLAYVGSTERWWAMYPQPQNTAQRYNLVQLPVTRGIAAPGGICTDGQSFYWWAKDGIYSSTKGGLTDADLYNLFPHEGVVGESVTYNGVTYLPPDYSQAARFRLAYANNYLYATYYDTNGNYHTLVCDVRRGAWSVDDYNPQVTVVYHPEQQAGTLITPVAGTRYDEVVMGTIPFGGYARVVVQTINSNDLGGIIPCTLDGFEFDGGDLRAPKQWGDLFVDCVPAAQGTQLMVNLVSLGAGITSAIGVPTGASRIRTPLDLGGQVIADFAGLAATWMDDFTKQSVPTRLYAWQPSFVIQPARFVSTYTFGTTFGLKGYFHIYELLLAYVSTALVTLTIGMYDGQSPAAITLPSTGGAYQKITFRISANKGLLAKFTFQSMQPFQIFEDDSEIYVGPWGRSGAYSVQNSLGVATETAGVV